MSKPLTISYSSTSTFRLCPYRYYLGNVMGYRLKEEDPKLIAGRVFHRGLEKWLSTADERLHAALNQMVGDPEWFKLEPEQKVLAELLMVAWDARNVDKVGDEVYQVEKRLYAPVMGPDGEPDPSLRLVAVLDVDGNPPQEHKTTGSDVDPGSRYHDRLSENQQVMVYFIVKADNGEPIDHLVWNAIKFPRTVRLKATPIEKRKYYKRGSKCGKYGPGDPYPGTRETDESMEEFRERVKDEIIAEPWRYFSTTELYRTEEEIDRARYDLWSTGKLMQAAIASGAFPRNQCESSCFAFGTECPYLPVCKEGLDPAKSPLYKIRRRK